MKIIRILLILLEKHLVFSFLFFSLVILLFICFKHAILLHAEELYPQVNTSTTSWWQNLKNMTNSITTTQYIIGGTIVGLFAIGVGLYHSWSNNGEAVHVANVANVAAENISPIIDNGKNLIIKSTKNIETLSEEITNQYVTNIKNNMNFDMNTHVEADRFCYKYSSQYKNEMNVESSIEEINKKYNINLDVSILNNTDKSLVCLLDNVENFFENKQSTYLNNNKTKIAQNTFLIKWLTSQVNINILESNLYNLDSLGQEGNYNYLSKVYNLQIKEMSQNSKIYYSQFLNDRDIVNLKMNTFNKFLIEKNNFLKEYLNIVEYYDSPRLYNLKHLLKMKIFFYEDLIDGNINIDKSSKFFNMPLIGGNQVDIIIYTCVQDILDIVLKNKGK